VNASALSISFIGAVVGGHEPLNVLQLLWVNLIMDTMGALALATELPSPALLDEVPHGHEAPLITKKMWKHIAVQGLYQVFWMLICLYALPIALNGYKVCVWGGGLAIRNPWGGGRRGSTSIIGRRRQGSKVAFRFA
jgi:Ca2+-transporting ATPase